MSYRLNHGRGTASQVSRPPSPSSNPSLSPAPGAPLLPLSASLPRSSQPTRTVRIFQAISKLLGCFCRLFHGLGAPPSGHLHYDPRTNELSLNDGGVSQTPRCLPEHLEESCQARVLVPGEPLWLPAANTEDKTPEIVTITGVIGVRAWAPGSFQQAKTSLLCSVSQLGS